jgi:hypothetical protein
MSLLAHAVVVSGVQLVTLLDGTIVHVSTHHRGSNHDSTVYFDSGVLSLMYPGYNVLGDGAYAGLPGVIAPFRRSLNPGQQLFNDRLRSVRVFVEHGICDVKSQFAIVRERVRHSDKDVIATAIEVCCLLRNFMRRIRH